MVGVGHLRKIDSMCLPRAYDVDIRSLSTCICTLGQGEAMIKISSPFRQIKNFLSLPVPDVFRVTSLLL